MDSRKCNKCLEVKVANEFYPTKTKSGKPSLSSTCKSCQSLIAQAYNLKKRNSRPKKVIEDLESEIWVPVKGFEDKYKVSNLARVKSIDRWVFQALIGKEVFKEGKLLSQCFHPQEQYPMVTLYGKSSKDKHPMVVYKIVWWSFNPTLEKKEGWHIDHIDQNRRNTKLDNLQYITCRDNCIKRSMHLKNRTSQYMGVSRYKDGEKWQTGIRYNKGKYSLGVYNTEEEAANAYQLALDRINKGFHPIAS